MENDVSTGARGRDFYAQAAKSLIKAARVDRKVSYKNLARLLEDQGTHVDVQVLINRVNQGKFSFAFALEVLAALGVERLEIPRPPAKTARAKSAPR